MTGETGYIVWGTDVYATPASINNHNGRYYSKESMKKALEDYMRKIRVQQRKEKLQKINELHNR